MAPHTRFLTVPNRCYDLFGLVEGAGSSPDVRSPRFGLTPSRSCQPRSVGPPAVRASGERRLRLRELPAFQPPHRPCPEISTSSFLLTIGSTPATSQEATRP